MEHHPGNSLRITEEHELVALLRAGGVPQEAWGTGAAKTVRHLLQEVQNGETRLSLGENGELIRSVVVAWVDVYGRDAKGQSWHLREDKQVFRDGRERRRQLTTSLGEKMLPGEDIIDATFRALSEELGVEEVEVVDYLGSAQTVHTPDSYPGLESRYESHHVRVDIAPSEFRPEGYVEYQADKSTYFVWEPIVT